MDQPSAELLDRLRVGDEDAAAVLFDRYVERLVALAGSRLSARLARRLDPEDVVLSAWRSFFVGARQGRFSLEHSGDLWRLLASITLHKLYRQAARHRAGRRALGREVPEAGGSILERLARDREPTPDEAAALADEVEQVLSQCDELARRVLELRLEGLLIEEIAAQVGRSERTVRRILDGVKDQWTKRLLDPGSAIPLPAAPRRRAARSTSSLAALRYDDYLLQKHLGSGGMGKVYRALHRPTGEEVAAKFLRKSFLSRRDVVERFLAEAQCVARLRHPGIVAVHGMGRTPVGGYFFAMDLVPGGDLARRIESGPVAVGEAIGWVAQAAEALEYAHGQGIVHCDLKPANLLLNDKGRVLVTDFGLHAAAGSAAFPGLAGTAGYMAPEQMDPARGPIGPWTDVYGLGAVLFALLTGRAPHTGRTVRDIVERVLSSPAPPDPRGPADVPEGVAEVCRRSLQSDPSVRPASAGELRRALNRVLESPGDVDRTQAAHRRIPALQDPGPCRRTRH